MKIQWFYYFSILSDSLNLSGAASVLDITPATLQQNMKQLEQTLGVALFQRHYSSLTEAGQYFKKQASRLLVSAEKIQQLSSQASEIKIAWSDFWGSTLLSEMVSQLREAHPERLFQAKGFQKNCQNLIDALNGRLVDLAMMTFSVNQHRVLPRFSSTDWAVFIGAETPYQIVSRPVSQLKDWADLSFVRFGGAALQSSLSQLWSEKIHPRQIRMTLPQLSLIKKLCQKSDLAAYLPEVLTRSEQAVGQLAVVAKAPVAHQTAPCLICSRELATNLNLSGLFRQFGFVSEESLV